MVVNAMDPAHGGADCNSELRPTPHWDGGREIQGGEARKMVAAGAALLDVRSPDEFVQGHLPGAVNIPIQDLDRRLGEVASAEGHVVVYCRTGRRSSTAARLLKHHGFTRFHDLGPMNAW